MANSKNNQAPVKNEQPVINPAPVQEPANQPEPNQPEPNQPEPVPAYMISILAARAVEDEANIVARVTLETALENASRVYVGALTTANFKQTAEVIASSVAVKNASDSVQKFDAELALLTGTRAEEDSKKVAIYALADFFKVEASFIEGLVAADIEAKNKLKANFTAVFGRPDLHVKQGLTGKQLTAGTSNGTSSNGTSSKGDKWAEAVAALDSGLTHAELLAKYPTNKKDGSVDAGKLNGTVRTVISEEGYVLGEDKIYRRAAKA